MDFQTRDERVGEGGIFEGVGMPGEPGAAPERRRAPVAVPSRRGRGRSRVARPGGKGPVPRSRVLDPSRPVAPPRRAAPSRRASEAARRTAPQGRGPSTGPAAEDAALVAALRRRDEAAFERLVALHQDRLLAVARRYFAEEEDARDAVQEAFLATHRSIDGFEGSARLATWLHRVVVNACLMKLRSRRRRPERSFGDEELATLAEPVPIRADRRLEEHESRARVRAAIACLPAPHRRVLELRDLEERGTRETARLLGVSSGAVKTRLHRARLALRESIEAGPMACPPC